MSATKSEPASHSSHSAKLVSTLAADPEMSELIELFVKDMHERVQLLESTISQGEYGELARLAHQLKGASAGYGFKPIGDMAGRVELAVERVESGQSNADALRRQVDELIELCRRASF